jgi:hypothetical protein
MRAMRYAWRHILIGSKGGSHCEGAIEKMAFAVGLSKLRKGPPTGFDVPQRLKPALKKTAVIAAVNRCATLELGPAEGSLPIDKISRMGRRGDFRRTLPVNSSALPTQR